MHPMNRLAWLVLLAVGAAATGGADPPTDAPLPIAEFLSKGPTESADGQPRGGDCNACDANCDSLHDLADVAPFVAIMIDGAPGCSPCAGDLDASNSVDGGDVQLFVDCLLAPPVSTGACCLGAGDCIVTAEMDCAGVWLGAESECSAAACAFGQLTAFRPQHGTGYFPFTRTEVSEADEESAATGPGIRVNHPGDTDPAGEDDLIELRINTTQVGIPLAIRRTHPALRLWSTRTKLAGSEVSFVNDRTSDLALNAGSATLWVEWAAAAHGESDLLLEPSAASFTLDAVRFHSFRSIVTALGGEGQVPSIPVDANNGTFVVAIALYQRGFDVHQFDEDNVSADGSGAVYNEIVTAIRDRLVGEVSIFGYSHGGGSTHDLSERLDNDRAGIGAFEIAATSYVDAVENDSDIDMQQELRRPPSTGYHANHFQIGDLFEDLLLDGGPVSNSEPPPTGLNVETTPWGAGSTHFQVDDFLNVRNFIESNIATRVTP